MVDLRSCCRLPSPASRSSSCWVDVACSVRPSISAGIEIAFTTVAVVVAQIFVSAPFFVRSARAGIAAVDRDLEDAARVDGASERRLFRAVTVPLATPALAAGLVMSWARALGEFGATIMFAGNVVGPDADAAAGRLLGVPGRRPGPSIAAASTLVVAALGVLLAVRVFHWGRVLDVRTSADFGGGTCRPLRRPGCAMPTMATTRAQLRRGLGRTRRRTVVGEFKHSCSRRTRLRWPIGVIIGGALGTVVNSLVNDIIMPPIGHAPRRGRLLAAGDRPQDAVNGTRDRVAIRYGAFLNAIIAFVIIAFVVWRISKMFIKEEVAAETKSCPFCMEANALGATKCRACGSSI